MADIDEQIRFTTFLSMTERDVSEDDAGAAMYAMHPFDSDVPCARALEKPVRKRSRKLARRLKNAAPSDVGRLAVEAIREYLREAEAAGDATYTERFKLMLEKYESDGSAGSA